MAAAATRYWVVSLPVQTSASSSWNHLRESISKQSFDTPVYRAIDSFQHIALKAPDFMRFWSDTMDFLSFLQFNTSDLRVGTLDSLLSLSDDLLKVSRSLIRWHFLNFTNLWNLDGDSVFFCIMLCHIYVFLRCCHGCFCEVWKSSLIFLFFRWEWFSSNRMALQCAK